MISCLSYSESSFVLWCPLIISTIECDVFIMKHDGGLNLPTLYSDGPANFIPGSLLVLGILRSCMFPDISFVGF